MGDEAGHGDVAGAGDIVPREGEAAVECAVPVVGESVERFEGVSELLGVVVPNILDAEVVDDEGESDRSRSVAEEAGSVGCGKVAMGA